jgi:predicted dehydrogenase
MVNYRAGIVGCGAIGNAHVAAYLSIEGIEVAACSDTNPTNLDMFSEKYHVAKKYVDYKEMLESEGLDIVSVCTWPKTHCEVTVKAAQSGVKGIMCEKPLAVNLGEADKMIDTCQRNGVVLAVGHEHRFDAQSQEARRIIWSGGLGDLKLIWGHCSLDLMNNGTHVIDLVNYLNMDVDAVWVMGQIDRRRKRFGAANHPDMCVEDMAIGHIKYRNGVEAIIELGEFAPEAFRFHIIGSMGQIEVNSPTALLKTITPSGIQCPDLLKTDPVRMEMVEMIKAIEERREHLSSGLRGRAALEIIMAVFESSRRRALIELPLNEKENPLEAMIKEGLI